MMLNIVSKLEELVSTQAEQIKVYKQLEESRKAQMEILEKIIKNRNSLIAILEKTSSPNANITEELHDLPN